MAMRSGLHIHPADGIGTSAQDARMALAGLVAAPGVLDGMTVTGTAGWQYSVGRGHVATTRGIDTDGVVVFTNDAPTLVDCTPSPGTGARIDVIYAKHNDAEAGDADNLPVLAVAEGIASGTPTAPEIPEGAIELARATVGAGATSTSHANVTISHGDQRRAILRGGIVTVNSDDQRDATYSATDQRPIFVWREDTEELQVGWGAGWKRIYPTETVAGRRVGGSTVSLNSATDTLIPAGDNADHYMGGVYGASGGIVVPVAGWYQVNCGVRFDTNTSGNRNLYLRANGTTLQIEQEAAVGFTTVTISNQFYLEAETLLQMYGWQNSGGTLGTSAAFGFPYLGAALLGQGA